MNSDYSKKVIIVGAGPAGISCAIQLKRSGIDPLVLEKADPGGMLKYANLVENYPAFPGGISGKELSVLMLRQFDSEGVKIHTRRVQSVLYSSGFYNIETDSERYTSQILVVATGTSPILIEGVEISVDAEKKVLYNPSDFVELKNQNIAIIGSGDLAFDYALNLHRFNKVEILCRSSKPKCLSLLLERLRNYPNCSYSCNTSVISVSMLDSGLRILCSENERNIPRNVDYLIAAIGRKPNIDFISDQLLVKLNEFKLNTSFFIIGDAFNKNYRQTAIAAGDGVKTAMIINEILKE
ncbi:MAG: NAD(P)/FAD-dependent oxidoreductase [Ignavibacteria bacterium]|nr:NAD(P)/FAD-dependent oxidoreductase [Ignavibacteria bacterium]MCC7159495.1 NAD(P)/FAD-dependent oxidoreductase [Ignavibacteria bacterium]